MTGNCEESLLFTFWKYMAYKRRIFQFQLIIICTKSVWIKEFSCGSFDVTTGSFNKAEVCEMVEIYLLFKLKETENKRDVGLYQDDDLKLLKGCNGRRTDKIRNYEVF